VAKLGVVADRDFGCLWLARTISHVGDYAFRIAFATHVIGVTGSPTVLAVSIAALLLPQLLFYLVGGVASDRIASRRTLLIVVDGFRCAVLALIAVAVATTDSIVLLVGLALLIGVGDGFFQPASFRLIKELTAKDKLVNANSAMSVGQQIGIIGGPIFGGLLVGLAGPTVAFAFDSATFGVSALLIAAIRYRGERARSEVAVTGTRRGFSRLTGDLREGLGHIRGQRWLRLSLVSGPIANAVFAGVLAVTVPLIMAPNGPSDADFLGAYYSLQAVGALAGAVLLGRITITRPGVVLFAMNAMMAASLAMVGVLGRTPVAFSMAFVYGVGLHIANTLFHTLLHEQVPDAVLSRVSSVADLAYDGMMPLGQILIGPLAVALSAQGATLAAGSMAVAVTASTLLAPSIRALRRARPEPDNPKAAAFSTPPREE
jgi:MFS family permease